MSMENVEVVRPATTEGRALAAIATDDFGGFYDERRAATDLRRYHEKGPQPWTKAMIEWLKAEAVEEATLLEAVARDLPHAPAAGSRRRSGSRTWRWPGAASSSPRQRQSCGQPH